MFEHTISVDLKLATETCCNCQTVFAMLSSLQRQCRESGRRFYCPNGHSQFYTDSEIDKLKRNLAAEKENAKYWQNRKNEVSEALKKVGRQFAAQKGVNTKLKKRVTNGVCPCCNRSFQNLRKHMQIKHPDEIS